MGALHRFRAWLKEVKATRKIVIGGNHDAYMEQIGEAKCYEELSSKPHELDDPMNYLEYTMDDCSLPDVNLIGSLRVFGVPFADGNTCNNAFRKEVPSMNHIKNCLHRDARARGERRPRLDILVTHGPCPSIAEALKPRLLHVHGHMHKMHGIYLPGAAPQKRKSYKVGVLTVCGSVLDNRYQFTQEPIVVDFPLV
eukprot:CAMPEP_0118873500 /NCGR_PEP_ID=MMETSP1163-20130328/15280_1 /TAXON_ID=124430 /ORGANISM="Phaeomonas parva, Strain CCMP2877" /LENGTH=195 /DNA_ID=CAMNT_0006808785 /DNA_START=96 /DNA_END=683 /DNA_ORIENTATION=+